MNNYCVAIIIGINTINRMCGNEISFYSRVTNKLTLTLTHKVLHTKCSEQSTISAEVPDDRIYCDKELKMEGRET